jgi:short-subunit dehydrogenase
MKKALIVGGASGIGLSIAHQLSLQDDYSKIYILDKNMPVLSLDSEKVKAFKMDLMDTDYSILDQFNDVNTLMITAGFGRLSLFADNDETDIANYFQVNTIGPIRILKHFYNKLLGEEDFDCGVMVSIAGFMSSPFFSLYGATKAALKIFIESVNVELMKAGSSNRILNVSPGSIKGTGFNQGATDLNITQDLAQQIIQHLRSKDDLFIPQYEEIYKEVLYRYQTDFRKEGLHSYDYKLKSGRIK